MRGTLVEKILQDHLLEGELVPGEEISIKIDQTLTQDATGTMAYLQFETMDIPRVQTELSVSYVDHNTLQTQFHNADDHRYLQSVAARYGILYSRAGNGICHQVHLERFGVPGKTLLGSDSHTPTNGGLGMFAMGAGGLDVAAAMAGAPYYLICPRVLRVWLTSQLRPWVSAKDIILEVLRRLTSKGNVGYVCEYAGPGVETLTIPERATITNMGAELGVTTSLFPSDSETKRFLESQGRGNAWRELQPTPDAEYEKELRLALDELVPLTACPHNPDNVVPVSEVDEIPVDQVMFGSCTNSSYKDVMIVATLLKGQRVHPAVSAGVAMGSRQVLEMTARDGALADFVAAGVRVLECACGFCIGNGQAPRTDAISLRTNNRNFLGRSGTRSAQVYLVSPETAAAAAITGRFLDPRQLESRGLEYPRIPMPDHFLVDDSMVLEPPADGSTVKIVRGPNIAPVPENPPLPATFRARVAIKVGDKVTTDHIMPAGQRLIYRSNVPKYAEYVFEPVDPTFPRRCKENQEQDLQNAIVAGVSYGQGSSREHAALCPMYLGVKVVIAHSFERIHVANLVNFGIVPLHFVRESDYDALAVEEDLEFRELGDQLAAGPRVEARRVGSGTTLPLEHALTPREVAIVRAGGYLNYWTRKQKEK